MSVDLRRRSELVSAHAALGTPLPRAVARRARFHLPAVWRFSQPRAGAGPLVEMRQPIDQVPDGPVARDELRINRPKQSIGGTWDWLPAASFPNTQRLFCRAQNRREFALTQFHLHPEEA